MSATRKVTLALIAVTVLTVSACGSGGGTNVLGGTGSGGSSAGSAGSPSAAGSSDPGAAPVSSDPAVASSPAASPSAASGIDACKDSGPSWCDTFADENSGWESHEPENATDFTSGYDVRTGTYHLANPEVGLNYATAPVKTTDFTSTGSVQLDVRLVAADTSGVGAGFVCWSGTPQSGTGYSGFVLTVFERLAVISVRSTTDGRDHVIAQESVTGLTPGTPQKLSAQCVQRADGSAFLGMRIDGRPLVSTRYSNGTSSYAWSVTPEVALQVFGPADVYFDDFAVSRIQGS